MYQKLKPPEKAEKNNEKKEDRGDVKLENNMTIRRSNCLQGMSAREAALKLHITPCTAQKMDSERSAEILKRILQEKRGSGRPVGRPAIMDDRHKTTFGRLHRRRACISVGSDDEWPDSRVH
ncbi:hypothetical protein BDF20DRAFT_891735 [Mycotypha africana]|uniref:uncharacterized protein n=1 Tax=Mycotypha africana TaxID=64632 RepID=UPI002300CC45|nr:uncharacterized protein BDF20DRAFT_891735 [Mycotypha africana]KAI8968850.1 hypothetical protein BDF20DRAFT_891735 [Mycotypha africana]